MDTKTPPIPLKVQEKSQPRKQERVADVSLPPLTPFHNHRPRQKPTLTTPWSRDAPCTIRYQEHHKKRPYRVLHIGATPLMYACQQADRTRVIRLLKEQEDTIGYRDRTLRTALHYCMDAGTGGAVAAAAPELVNAPDAEGHTPLHLAVIAGDTQLVAVLLANGADVNAKDLEGHSVLHWATVCGEAECVRLVLSAGARPSTPDLRGGSPLHYAAQCCGAAATAELAVPKKVGLKVLQTLLEFGADVNAKDEDGRQPILWAASAGSVEAVLALARAGGAAAAGASDKDGLTALHCAASRGHARCIEALVNLCGSQPDHVDDNGCSALHYAATLGHADATALILKLGADPNRQDRKGRTPALCAAAKGQLETLKILAQHGGSLHARTVRGTGVAHEAVASGRIELIKWLAKKRPSTLDIATHDGKTPLHIAALHGHLDACKVLLDNGARLNAVLRTSKGNLMTPLDAALYRGHRDCAKLIQLHGGTTAQNLAHKPASNKVFAARIRMRHTDTSTESDSSSRERSRSYRPPKLYYEERWIERRTRRRGSLRKVARRDSRSFSEEEVRMSKTSSKRDHDRRARSESARFDDGDSTERKLRRKRSRKRTTKYKHDYSESSVDSDSYIDENLRGRESSRSKSEKPSRSKSREDKEKNNGMEKKEESKKEEIDKDEDETVSDDSLEVVVVKRSLERKCEKVISGRRSKTPRESSREMKVTKSHRSTRKKSKSGRNRSPDNGEDPIDRTQSSSDKGKGSKETTGPDSPRKSVDEEKGNQEGVIETRYRKDITDSTSQETVERVVVTALIHKDQGPDTPKSTLEASKEVTFDDHIQTESIQTESKIKTDEHADQTEQVKQEVPMEESEKKEESKQRRRKSQDKTEDTASSKTERKVSIDKSQSQESKIEEQGKLETQEITESGSPSTDSQKGYQRLESQKEEESSSKSEKTPISSMESSEKEVRRRSQGSLKLSEESQGQGEASSSGEQKQDDTPRTAMEDIPTSEQEEKQLLQEDSKKGKSKLHATKSKTSIESKKSRSSSDSSKKSDTSPRRNSDPRKRRDSIKRRESITRRSSIKATGEKSEEKVEAIEVQKQVSIAESPDDKDQVDSARGKSVDLSTESKDSALMEDADVESLRTDTPVAMQGIADDEQTAEDQTPRKFEIDLESKKEDAKKLSRTDGAERTGEENSRYIDESLSSSPKSPQTKPSRPTTAKSKGKGISSSKSPGKRTSFESSEERSPDRSAIVAVFHSPEWDEEDEEAVEKEIRDAIGEETEHQTEPDQGNELGVLRVLPSTSEEETPRTGPGLSRTSGIDSLPQVQPSTRTRLTRVQSPPESGRSRLNVKQRRDSCGRDSGIEPSPRVSRIPRRRITRCCPNTEKQRSLNMETITKDVQVSLRRYHLERKIFFQLMELKRLQIRHGRANEHVLVKRQVDAFNRSGMSGPTLGVTKYEQPLTFRDFEAFLYEQLRKLQRRPATPDFCTEARQCTQRTHRCHHATSAYTSAPVYTYLGGGAPERADLLPKIESRGKGQMTVEVTHGEEKQVIALPAERLDRSKRYFVTFTVRGECQESEKPKSSNAAQRNAKSV